MARRKFWGWGWEGEGPTRTSRRGSPAPGAALRLRDVALRSRASRTSLLRTPRVTPPGALAEICSTSALRPRRAHLRQVVPRRRARLRAAISRIRPISSPSRAASRTSSALLDWCSDARVAAIPTAAARASSAASRRPPTAHGAAPSRSTSARLDRVLEIDRTSRAARIQAGVLGPALEDQLRPRRLTLRHFPQSFEFSTLGGWIATRSGGHFATLYTHIDDFVEALRVVTPGGVVETRRLPGSGAGPSPDRLFIGSEGILGIITEAWMRLQDRPQLPRLGGRHLRRASPRGAGPCAPSARPVCTRPTAACSTPARPCSPGPATATQPSCCSPSSRPTTRSTPGCSAPSSAAATTAATCPTAPARRAAKHEAGARGRGGRLAQRFPRRAVPARRPGRHGHDHRDLRDRHHLGPLRGVPRAPSSKRRARRRGARLRRRHASPVASPTPTRTARRPTTASSPQAARETSCRSGRRSRPRAARRSSAAAAPSPTTTPSAATTAPGTTASVRGSSPSALARRQGRLDPAGILNPGVLIDPV